MTYADKEDDNWRRESHFLHGNALTDICLPRRFPSALDLLPHLDQSKPGTHYTREGFFQVPPPASEASFIQLSFRGHARQMEIFSVEPSLLKPLKKSRLMGRKTRYTQVTMDLGEMMVIDSIMVPYDGSAIRVFAKGELIRPKKTVIENYYKRAKRRKILGKFIQYSELPEHSIDGALRLFTQVLGVDTNTFLHSSGRRVSVTAVCLLKLKGLSRTETMFETSLHDGFASLDVHGNPEVLGWIQLIRKILPPRKEVHKHRIALVVDSELTKIDGYQERSEPFVDDLFLPSCFDLVYASDSSGKDQFVVNKLIATCHRYSQLAAKEMKELPISDIEGAADGLLQL